MYLRGATVTITPRFRSSSGWRGKVCSTTQCGRRSKQHERLQREQSGWIRPSVNQPIVRPGDGRRADPPEFLLSLPGCRPGRCGGDECHGASQSRVSLCAAGGCLQRAGARCKAGRKAQEEPFGCEDIRDRVRWRGACMRARARRRWRCQYSDERLPVGLDHGARRHVFLIHERQRRRERDACGKRLPEVPSLRGGDRRVHQPAERLLRL